MTTEFTPIAAHEDAPRHPGGAPANLTVVFPGLMGNAIDQTTPIRDTLLHHGETLLVQPGGTKYDAKGLAERSAEAISKHLERRGFESITFTGISLGGLAAATTIAHLGANNSFAEHSVMPDATFVDVPSGLADLAGIPPELRRRPALVRGTLRAMRPLSPLLDKTPVIAMMTPPPKGNRFEKELDGDQLAHIGRAYRAMAKTRFSTWRDQVESIVAHEPPQPRSLDVLASLAYVRSLDGDDVVVAESATNTWGNTVDYGKFAIFNAQMPHAAFDQAPRAANDAIRRSYIRHKTKRDHAAIASE